MITPVLLCGGSGTRLWPLSRKSYPKQFAPIIGEETLFQASAKRLSGEGYGAPLLITGSDFRFIVTEQLQTIGIDPGAILIEPAAKNTAAAILAASLHVASLDPDGLMLVAPSDHVIPDAAAFRAAVGAGVQAAQSGQIVTFGITPDRAETGYGYLELTQVPKDASAIKLMRFVEKPDSARAAEMLAAGNFLWNGGIFLFTAQTMIEAFQKHAPDTLSSVMKAYEEAQTDLGFLRLAAKPWDELKDISVDYAIMERAENISAVPFSGAWSDLGGWDAVWSEMGPDASGVALSGAATSIECENTLLRAESEAQELVGIGLKDIIAISTADAVLVADKSRAQDVKKAVEALKAKEAPQATHFPKDHRPWGWFESLVIGNCFQVKRIHVHPGAALSLQSHLCRAEHWIVVEGTAKVTIDDEVKILTENQSVYIPLGAIHRMENAGEIPMVLIEVQTGSYLGEDDIIRYDDIYERGQGEKG